MVILVTLGATSFDAAIRRLGRRWNQLHRLVYLAATLGIIHFFLQSKVDVSEPVVMAGFFLWLMAFRVARPRRRRAAGAVAPGGPHRGWRRCPPHWSRPPGIRQERRQPEDGMLEANFSLAIGATARGVGLLIVADSRR